MERINLIHLKSVLRSFEETTDMQRFSISIGGCSPGFEYCSGECRALIFFFTLLTPLTSYLGELGQVLKRSELITCDLINKKV